jgi:hypothetical protein
MAKFKVGQKVRIKYASADFSYLVGKEAVIAEPYGQKQAANFREPLWSYAIEVKSHPSRTRTGYWLVLEDQIEPLVPPKDMAWAEEKIKEILNNPVKETEVDDVREHAEV